MMAAESGGHPWGCREVFEGSALTTSSQMPWCGVVSGSHLTTELGYSSPDLHHQWAVQTLWWSRSHSKAFLKEQHERRSWLLFSGMPASLPPWAFIPLLNWHPSEGIPAEPGAWSLILTLHQKSWCSWNHELNRSECPDTRSECHLYRKTVSRRRPFWGRTLRNWSRIWNRHKNNDSNKNSFKYMEKNGKSLKGPVQVCATMPSFRIKF